MKIVKALLSSLLSLAATLALSGLALAQEGSDPADFVTGGGWITGTPTAARANFGFKAGVDENGAFFGRLNYVDHEDQLHLKGTTITDYVVVDDDTRQFEGSGTIDGQAVTFVVTVTDAGEPGTSDTFEITISTGYTASGTLQGGNIQLHTED
jgi:hypothetical protein